MEKNIDFLYKWAFLLSSCFLNNILCDYVNEQIAL